MLSYEKKALKWKKRSIVILSLFLVAAVGTLTYWMNQQNTDGSEPTVAQNESVPLKLPDTAKEETIQRPYGVEAKIAVDYFDGTDGEADAFTKFEDVYRSSQGIDYTFNKEAFAVKAMVSGTISDIREDELFGKTVELTCDDLVITMQSVSDVKVKKGDTVKQDDTLASAGTCVYSKDLGNHLHLVVEYDGQIVDPQNVFDKTVSELKQS